MFAKGGTIGRYFILQVLAPVKDAEAYAQRIRMLAAQPELYREIQKRLQKRQRESFTPQATVGGYLRLIEELRKTHEPKRFEPIPLKSLPMSKYHKRRSTRAWWFLQKLRDGICR